MSDLTNNLIPTGTLLGTLSVGAGTTDYNGLENKPQINNVTLSGNKSAADLGLVSSGSLATVATTGNYGDLNNIPPATYILNFNMCTAPQVITSTDYIDFASQLPTISSTLNAGVYTYALFVNAKWSNGSYQFYSGINIDGDIAAATNSLAQAQENSTCVFLGNITVPTTGSHTFKVQFKVSSATKEVTIMSYTSVMAILIRRT